MWVHFRSDVSAASEAAESAAPLPTQTATAEPEPVSPEMVRALVEADHPLTVSVLGDSTGNDSYEWVSVWAGMLAQHRAVTLHVWDDDRHARQEPQVLSTVGSPVTIWNMSAPGQSANYPEPMIRKAVPERPDLVIYNYGHNNTPDDIDVQLYATMQAVKRAYGDVPGVLIAQNPSTTDLSQRQRETVWKVIHEVGPGNGMPVVDVFHPFESAPGPVGRLLVDGTHPNAAGGRLWAQVVARTIGS